MYAYKKEITGNEVLVGFDTAERVQSLVEVSVMDLEYITSACFLAKGMDGTAYTSMDAPQLREIAAACSRAAELLERRAAR